MAHTHTHSSTVNLREGSLFKNIFLFGLPLMLSNLLQVLFNISDVAVVGKFAGGEALGSVGSTSIVVVLFTGLLIGLGTGVNALAARFIGSGNQKAVAEISHTSFLTCLTAGILLSIAGLVISEPLLHLLGTKDELLPGAVLYCRIYFLGMPALAVYNYGNGIFSADGNTKLSLFFLAAAGVVNVGLNLLFVIVFQMSVAGVALGSIISQYMSAVLVVVALVRADRPYKLRFTRMQLSRLQLRNLLRLGVPAGLQNAIFSLANLFIQAGVNTFDTVMVEGNSAALNADSIVYDIMAAFYTACTSFMSQNYGAGKRDRVLKSYFVCLFYFFAIGAAASSLLLVFGREFLSIFTSDPAIVEAGMKRMNIMCLSYAFSAFMDNTIAANRGLNRTFLPTVIVIMGSCVMRIIWVYTVFAYFKTVPSLYLLYIFSWTITATAEILYFIHVFRQTFPAQTGKAVRETQQRKTHPILRFQ